MHRIMKRISQTLGPFTPNEILRFNPEEGFSTVGMTQDKNGRFDIRPRGNQGFFESLYRELPRGLQRRFLLLDEDGPAPTPHQYRVLEHRILGYARRKLMHELVARINALPLISSLPLPRGRNGGRLAVFDRDERRRIRATVEKLLQSGNDGEPMSKRKACEAVASRRGLSSRHVWRIVLGH